MMNNNQSLLNWINRNKGKLVGLLAGFIFAILLLLIGFLKTLVILIFALIGLYLGHLWDGGRGIQQTFKNIYRK